MSDPIKTTKVENQALAAQRAEYLATHKIADISIIDLVDLVATSGDFRALPNDLARSALFTARNRSQSRQRFFREPLFHLHASSGLTVLYTGEELRAVDDELVFMQCLEFARPAMLGHVFRFTLKEMVAAIGLSKSSTSYDTIRACFSRLRATEVLFNSTKSFGRSESFSLIKKYSSINDAGGQAEVFEMMLDPEIAILFAGRKYSSHEWATYRDLSPVERKLVDYIQSHREPRPLAVEAFGQLCGASPDRAAKGWRETVRKACLSVTEKTGVECSVMKTMDGYKISIKR